MDRHFTYIVVGGGLAGGSAVDGIREIDSRNPVLLIGAERFLPYDRPPLTKKLWFHQKKVEDLFMHNQSHYDVNKITVELETSVASIDASRKTVTDSRGETYRFEKLLLATGGYPRTLPIPGGNLDGIYYYRYLNDYLRLREQAGEGVSATVIGGGFIGSEIAAALRINKVNVTVLFPESYLCARVFPRYLGLAIQQHFRDRGIAILEEDAPVSISRKNDMFTVQTKKGAQVRSEILIVGIGILPSIELARAAGLEVGNGIVVNQYLATSHPDIFAAGDNALFPYQALGRPMRVEHWDNAVIQGKQAGRNMAGASEPYTHLPYFFSDLFDFGYEAVGDVNSELQTYPDWQKENDTGIIYYVQDHTIRGAMMCNVWNKVDAARDMIRRGEKVTEKLPAGMLR